MASSPLNRTVPAETGDGARRGVHRGGRRARTSTPSALEMLGGEEEPAGAVGRRAVAAAVRRAPGRRWAPRAATRRRSPRGATRGGSSPPTQPTDEQWAISSSPGRCAPRSAATPSSTSRICQAFGIGAGQQNRLDSARIAAERSAGRATRRCLRERRLLPVPRRPRRGRRSGYRRGDPARRLGPRRRGHRRRRRTRHRHGLHRPTPLPPLNDDTGSDPCVLMVSRRRVRRRRRGRWGRSCPRVA